MVEKTKEAKHLEDYQPGATRDDVMTSLKKVLDMSKQLSKGVKNNGKTNSK